MHPGRIKKIERNKIKSCHNPSTSNKHVSYAAPHLFEKNLPIFSMPQVEKWLMISLMQFVPPRQGVSVPMRRAQIAGALPSRKG